MRGEILRPEERALVGGGRIGRVDLIVVEVCRVASGDKQDELSRVDVAGKKHGLRIRRQADIRSGFPERDSAAASAGDLWPLVGDTQSVQNDLRVPTGRSNPYVRVPVFRIPVFMRDHFNRVFRMVLPTVQRLRAPLEEQLARHVSQKNVSAVSDSRIRQDWRVGEARKRFDDVVSRSGCKQMELSVCAGSDEIRAAIFFPIFLPVLPVAANSLFPWLYGTCQQVRGVGRLDGVRFRGRLKQQHQSRQRKTKREM